MTFTNTVTTWLVKNMIGNDSQWFWAMAQVFAVAISLWFIWRQIHFQRMANSLSTLAQFESRWTSQEMSAARKAVCEAFRDNARFGAQSTERVACFFEELGLHVTSKVFELAMVWELYSTYIEHYWPILEPRVAEMQKKDPSVYTSFQDLHRRIKEHSRKKKAPAGVFSHEELLDFVKEELDKN